MVRPFIVLRNNPLRLEVRQATKQGYIVCPVGGAFDASYVNSKLRRGRVQGNGKIVPTITSNSADGLLLFVGVVRR